MPGRIVGADIFIPWAVTDPMEFEIVPEKDLGDA
jgi:hypothetical protein